MKKEKLFIWILVALLAVSLIYISVDKYISWKQSENTQIYVQGFQNGYEQAVVEIVNNAVTCQPVSLTVGNQSMNLIATACLSGGS